MICVIDTFVIYHIYCSKPLHQSVITLPSFTTSKTDNLLFLGSFQNTSEHILKPPALCRLSFLHLFDHNNNNNQNKSKQACASIVAIVFSAYLLPASASIRTVRACALGIYASAHKRSVLISSAFLSGKAVHFF